MLKVGSIDIPLTAGSIKYVQSHNKYYNGQITRLDICMLAYACT